MVVGFQVPLGVLLPLSDVSLLPVGLVLPLPAGEVRAVRVDLLVLLSPRVIRVAFLIVPARFLVVRAVLCSHRCTLLA
jgi:hypothetical protein